MKRLCLFALLVAAVAAGLLAGLFHSQTGHARLERWLNARLAGVAECRGLSVDWPFRIRLASLTMLDADGVWLTARGLDCAPRLADVWRRELVLTHATARAILMQRVPRKTAPRAPRSAAPAWPVWIQQVQVDALQLESEVLGEPLSLALRGAFKSESEGWSAAFSASARWREEPLLIVGSVRRSGAQGVFDLHRVAADGVEAHAQGTWWPARQVAFDLSFTNAPLIARLSGVAHLGRGHVSGAVQWKPEFEGELRGRIEDIDVAGVRVSNCFLVARGAPSAWTTEVSVANGAWRAMPWRAGAPISIRRTQRGLEWQAPALVWGPTPASCAGYWAATGMEASLEVPLSSVANTPLAAFFRAGLAGMSLRVRGPPDNPTWSLEAEGRDLEMRVPLDSPLRPVNLRIRADAVGGTADVHVVGSGWTAEPATLTATLPLRLPLDGRAMGPDPAGPIQARLQWGLNLAELGAITDLRGAQLAGTLSGDLEIAGTWAEPLLLGRIALEQGRAEFPASGTLLRDVQVVLEGDRRQLAIREARASDGAGGRVVLDGAIQFNPASGFPLDMGLTLTRAALWQEDGSRLLFDGRVAVTGPLAAPVVTGRLDLVDSEIRIRPAPPSVPELPLAGEITPQPSGAFTSAWLNAVALDVALRGREIRIAGRGLDSTWRADLRATGRAAAPRLRGSLTAERGYFLFMGRRFALERAALIFDGRHPPAPLLDVTATSRAGDLQARFYAAGPIDAPELNLESEPAYPVDEILAQLLFGRSADTISPFQAVRLAHGLNVLRGRGRTLDVLERGQSALRVDQLEIVQSDQAADISAISVGKYVGRSVYIEGEKGLGGAADQISVEIERTPSLILTTESTPRIREGIGIQWRRDY